jgi:hypothetical protein
VILIKPSWKIADYSRRDEKVKWKCAVGVLKLNFVQQRQRTDAHAKRTPTVGVTIGLFLERRRELNVVVLAIIPDFRNFDDANTGRAVFDSKDQCVYHLR